MKARDFFCHPDELRAPGQIEFQNIPVNQYQKTVKDELGNYTNDEFTQIYEDMLAIRHFEEMVGSIRTTDQYEGIHHHIGGTAHPGHGEEAASVGMCFLLKPEDFIFGNHRAHCEVLAKGFSAIRCLDDNELMNIMKNFMGGRTLRAIESTHKFSSVKELARNFLLYGIASDIFAKETGFCKGLGGSMHVFFAPFGIYPSNAIVGGGAPLATGAALYKKINKKPGVVVCSCGDGATGCGPVYEAMNFAAMRQYSTYWGEEFEGGLPIIYNVMDNLYGMSARTRDISMGANTRVRMGAGIADNQMLAERVDGYNPLAVIDAYRRKLKGIKENKESPVLLDVVTYRLLGHNYTDPEAYRAKAEVAEWRKVDPIITYKNQLLENSIISSSKDEEIIQNSLATTKRITAAAADMDISPRMNFYLNPEKMEGIMFSNQRVEKMDDSEPEVKTTKEENSRVARLRTKERFYMKDGKPVSPTRLFQLRDGLFEAIFDKYYVDPTLTFFGEDVREWGGHQGVSRAMDESIPQHRLFDTPISEAAIAGVGCGYAMSGGRAIAELQFMDFLARCADEVFNQTAKWQSMSAGVLKMPLIIRMVIGNRFGAQHSQDFSSLCTHIPGLKVVYPVTPYDAKGLMASALNMTDPVIFIESQKVYDKGEMFHESGVPEGHYEIPFGEPDVKREGSDVTILTIGPALYTAIEAADELQAKYDVSAEVIDLRTLVPINYVPILESIKKTGRIMIIGEAVTRGSFLNSLAQDINDIAAEYLKSPAVVIGSRNWICAGAEFEEFFYPQVHWILDAVHQKLIPLEGHRCKEDFSAEEKIRRASLGI